MTLKPLQSDVLELCKRRPHFDLELTELITHRDPSIDRNAVAHAITALLKRGLIEVVEVSRLEGTWRKLAPTGLGQHVEYTVEGDDAAPARRNVRRSRSIDCTF